MGDPRVSIDVKQFVEKEVGHLCEKMGMLREKNDSALVLAKTELDGRLSMIDERIRSLNKKYDRLSKIAYIAIGVAFVLELVFKFLVK